jgi:ElaB/YqjD/DUF883 family membrane-anchored ribosome-binding protein
MPVTAETLADQASTLNTQWEAAMKAFPETWTAAQSNPSDSAVHQQWVELQAHVQALMRAIHTVAKDAQTELAALAVHTTAAVQEGQQWKARLHRWKARDGSLQDRAEGSRRWVDDTQTLLRDQRWQNMELGVGALVALGVLISGLRYVPS